MGPVFQAVVAVASLVMGAQAASSQREAQNQARQAQESAQAEQRKAVEEQKASQAAQAAAERRQQLREERVKRARLMQASIGTGVSGSSGEAGAAGNMSTQLGANIGFNLGQQRTASAISGYNQNASDFLSSANNKIAEANQWGAMKDFSMNIFSKSGGFSAIESGYNDIFLSSQPPAPVEIRK